MKTTHFALPVVLLWLCGWALLPQGIEFNWLGEIRTRWLPYDTGSFLTLFFLSVCLLRRVPDLSRYERISITYCACIGAVNAIREIITAGANNAFELILGIPLGLIFLLLVYYRLFRKEKAPKSFGGQYSENKGIGFRK